MVGNEIQKEIDRHVTLIVDALKDVDNFLRKKIILMKCVEVIQLQQKKEGIDGTVKVNGNAEQSTESTGRKSNLRVKKKELNKGTSSESPENKTFNESVDGTISDR